MNAFSNLSIRKKLMLLFTGTASVTVLIACAILWAYQLVHYRSSLVTEESAMAQLIAESSAPALLFNDAAAANDTLDVLRADPRIETACLYDKAGRPVARFASSSQSANCPAGVHAGVSFTRHNLIISRSIKMQTELVGSLYLDVSLTEIYGLLLHLGEAGGLVLLMTSLFALALSSFLERIISRPLIHLTQVASQVSDEGNYLLRAKSTSNDEAGMLINQFNAMMDRIQQREADLQQAHDGLEDKVKMRTRKLLTEIAERKLIERDLEIAKLAAEEANRAKSAFLATMSHELRTPLNAIIGYSEMLYEDAQAAAAKEMSGDLNKVLMSARHLLTLISDVLDFSKIEAGQMKVHMEPVLASSLLRDVLSTADVLARHNHNVLEVCQPAWEGLLLVDAIRFRQCLLNLLSNSCKFTEKGHISICIGKKFESGKDWIQWSVTDTGIGIPAAALGKLFRTFSQVDSSSTRKYGGSGLGLAISEQLCQAMGGHITVVSELGAGSTFTINMPAYTPVEEPVTLAG
jgi:signal transduction histidine kinase